MGLKAWAASWRFCFGRLVVGGGWWVWWAVVGGAGYA